MKIRYLNGPRLRRALIAGSNRVIKNREYLNSINVFPVADSDTGTNMAGTLQHVMNGLMHCMDNSVHETVRCAADAALLGARGNSGVILAQFLHGLAEELKDTLTVTTRSFGSAVHHSVDYAYDAISNPQEGTILTVLKDWASSVYEKCSHTDDFAELLNHSVGAAESSLADTPTHLEVLQKAGVVDAGARGFVDLLQGITQFIHKGQIRELEQIKVKIEDEGPIISDDMGEIAFQYCTECIIEGVDIDHKALRAKLGELGDSLIVAGSSSKTKIHVHTNEPNRVFSVAEAHGKLLDEKADDMRDQFRSAHTQHGEIALVVDSSCDLPPDIAEELNLHIVPLKVIFGEKTYIDKVSLTPLEFYELMRNNPDIHPQTSQPTPSDFRDKFEFLGTHYKSILGLNLAGALSGTFQSAQTAARYTEADTTIELIDSRLVSVAEGLLVRRVGEAVRDGTTLEEAKALALRLIPRTKLYVTVPALDSLIRGGRLSKMKGVLANSLNLKPIITLDAKGKAIQTSTVFGVKGGKKKILEILHEELDDSVPTDFAVTHVDAAENARWFADRIREEFTTDHDIFSMDATPVLAAHAGFGAVAVAFITPEAE